LPPDRTRKTQHPALKPEQGPEQLPEPQTRPALVLAAKGQVGSMIKNWFIPDHLKYSIWKPKMNSTTAKPGFHVGRDLLLGGGEVIIYEIYGKFMPNNGNVDDSTREKALTMPSHPE